MNEVTTRMATDRIQANRTRGFVGSATNSSTCFFPSGPTDLDLLQLTMNRMQKAESDLRFATSELKEKVKRFDRNSTALLVSLQNKRIAVLEEKVQLYEKALSRADSGRIPVLEEKCRRLQSIIDRMEVRTARFRRSLDQRIDFSRIYSSNAVSKWSAS